jgi:hypothetical protein
MHSAFENEHIHGARRFVSEHQFFVGELPQRVTVRLYQSLDRDWVEFEQSHFINTPLQIDAYKTSSPYGDDEDDALRLAVDFCLVQWYEQAVREGHSPDESWLVPNPRFQNFLERPYSVRSQELAVGGITKFQRAMGQLENF